MSQKSAVSRRRFLKLGAATSPVVLAPSLFVGAPGMKAAERPRTGRARNVIFLVSDGMSVGTLSMADQLLMRRDGRRSNWMRLVDEAAERGIRHCKMDMASANSIVTDSAAAASSWGCGHRLNNGSVNVGPRGEEHRTILEYFQDSGRSTGLVTTTSLTHATPAGFGANVPQRGMEARIAEQYLERRYDVLLGGGDRHLSATHRQDGRSMYAGFSDAGYHVVRDRTAMLNLVNGNRRLLGIFAHGHLPYSLDHQTDSELRDNVPTLAEMTDAALKRLARNEQGFILQVEGGRVDHAAHANDVGGLLYDQIAFDDAIGVAMAFAENRDDTLVIITTDHGNANPGLNGVSGANEMFDAIQNFRHTNNWILSRLNSESSTGRIRERVEAATGLQIRASDARVIQESLRGEYQAVYRIMSRPGQVMGQVLANYVAVNFVGGQHTSDYVDLLAWGPGSDTLSGFVRNTDLFDVMMASAGIKAAHS
jgi:alkaline phosphatase